MGKNAKMVLFCAVWILLVGTAAARDHLDIIIKPPKEAPRSGQMAEFSVYVHNTGDEMAHVILPARVSCRIGAGNHTEEVVATATEPLTEMPAAVGKNGFVKGRYEFIVPTDFQGPVYMEVREFHGAAVMFAVAAVKEPETQLASVDEADEPEAYPTLDSLSTLYQPYLVNLAAYEPLYFLVGANPEKSKFQLSFKYRFFNPSMEMVEDSPWLKGLHFGYTQTSFWDLKSDSAPFEDTIYKPEVFYLSPNIKGGSSWIQGLFFQTGFQHESNGRGGDLSRSTNLLYAKPFFIFYDEDTRLGIQVAPKMWVYVHNDDDTNPDLKDYRGYFDLEMKMGKVDSFVLGSHLRWADEGVSTQVDFTYPLHWFLFHNFDFYFHVQYVNALAESLIDYRDRTEALRVGLAIVR